MRRHSEAEAGQGVTVAAAASAWHDQDPATAIADAPDPGRCREAAAPALPAPELCIVIPTFNEAANIPELAARLDATLRDIRWEAIVVDDDSPDGTASLTRRLGRSDPRIRAIRRIGRRGLSSACIEGLMATTAPLIAVMDADLQHDERLLPAMVRAMRDDPALDLVIGSRYLAGGGVGDWGTARQRVSRAATWLARRIGPAAAMTDPMSGFFMLRSTLAQEVAPRLSGIGFKILLDLVASAGRALRVAELPYGFRRRNSGESKLDGKVAWDYLMLLGDKTIGRFVPIRFVLFSLVGAAGVLVHLAVLYGLLATVAPGFAWAQAVAALVAMTANFLVNNALTYRDRKLRGFGLLRGWLSFVAACGIGAAANVGVAAWLFAHEAGLILAALAGIAIGAVWNYAVTAVYTWRAPSG